MLLHASCKSATTNGVKKALRENIIARVGVPKVLLTDNGSQFNSRALKQFLENFRHQFTAPYTSQENRVERTNRTLKTIITQVSEQEQRKWDEHLPEIMLALNSSVSTSTGYSPAYIIHGRTPRLPSALFDEPTLGTNCAPIPPETKQHEMHEIQQIVKLNLQSASQDQAKHYNLLNRARKPEIGDMVFAKTHPLFNAQAHFATKLAPKFSGPYQVVNFISSVIIKLKHMQTHKESRAHISELKTYYHE
ncbi:uncharacterized protein LOC119675353 [Teleopsis dalmanni]|uniref:uncharacterized protein LOC119675353 n=1 Tax=Teleopsis dalmanni TaxID=139649 RepID=UPI0018CDBF29|nr:uncharacterized protein LOC119675353 [Teleopsis dalmanni]